MSFVDLETKNDALLMINSRNVSFIRAEKDSEGFPRCIIFFCGDESLIVTTNKTSINNCAAVVASVVELDDLISRITGDKGRY